MNIYTVDNIKEQIIKNNPFWTKYITISGKYCTDIAGMYVANDDETIRIRIDEGFRETITSLGICEGASIKLEGFLNYGGERQKSNDDKDTKIQNINFSNSKFTFWFYPKKVEADIEKITPIEKVGKKQEFEGFYKKLKDDSGLGCLAPVLILLIIILFVYIWKEVMM